MQYKVFYSRGCEPFINSLRRHIGLDSYVLAVGGGRVIDEAKLYATKYAMMMYACPTTLAGATMTSRATLWKPNRKLSLKTVIPKTIMPEKDMLKKDVISNSMPDFMAHILDVEMHKDATPADMALCHVALELSRNGQEIQASLIAGHLIEIYGTTLIHALSYPLTTRYEIPHAEACNYARRKLSGVKVPHDIDWDLVCKEALQYKQIHNTFHGKLNMEYLKRLIK